MFVMCSNAAHLISAGRYSTGYTESNHITRELPQHIMYTNPQGIKKLLNTTDPFLSPYDGKL